MFRVLGCVFLFGSLLTVTNLPRLCAGQGNAPTFPQAFSLVSKLVRAAYPEIPKDASMSFTVTSPIDEVPVPYGDIGFEVRAEVARKDIQGPSRDTSYVMPERLSGLAVVTSSGRLEQASLGGHFANTEKTEGVRRLVESHPEWTERQAIAALEHAGARYGPRQREAFLKQVTVHELSDVLGKVVIESADFKALSSPHEGSFAKLDWNVLLEVQTEDGAPLAYDAIFEAFGGRLTFIEKVPLRGR